MTSCQPRWLHGVVEGWGRAAWCHTSESTCKLWVLGGAGRGKIAGGSGGRPARVSLSVMLNLLADDLSAHTCGLLPISLGPLETSRGDNPSNAHLFSTLPFPGT